VNQDEQFSAGASFGLSPRWIYVATISV